MNADKHEIFEDTSGFDPETPGRRAERAQQFIDLDPRSSA